MVTIHNKVTFFHMNRHHSVDRDIHFVPIY